MVVKTVSTTLTVPGEHVYIHVIYIYNPKKLNTIDFVVVNVFLELYY